MDTKIFELESEQGASTSADLLQQEPHLEVTDLKPSAASSVEERLAAGISTFGLQIKRFSRAQRKKAYYRKEDEGGNLDGKETSRNNSFISGQECGGQQWRCDKTSFRLTHTILEKTATEKKPGTLPKCRLGRTRKL
jgi:hypothetical protein